ncbi:MAG: ferritin-like domain-containing protein [Methylobacter sp.]|nr:ferritin-like domain-containing protein [Methylobacter sp.]
MKNIFEFAEAFFHQESINEKLALTHLAWQACVNGNLAFSSESQAMSIDEIKFPTRPELLPPRQMPRRKLTTEAGVKAFFHAIAHVEFVAIYLAWDILYRFRDMPEQFYQDWLRVADEEAQHFELIRTHLRGMQVEYGDLPAHSGLWDHAKDTADDLPDRLALVPRCMEARGLDVTPALIEKFKLLGDEASVAILTRILTDEVGHVELGSFWFKSVCKERGFEAEQKYRELIDEYYVGGKPKGPFNRELRKTAGFSDAEIDWLEA